MDSPPVAILKSFCQGPGLFLSDGFIIDRRSFQGEGHRVAVLIP